MCPPEQDKIHSAFRNANKILPKVIPAPTPSGFVGKIKMPKKATCYHCKAETRMRICATCHSELPYTIGDYKDMIISVIGAKESGKSHYISVLLNQVMNEIGSSFNCNLSPLNDETIKRYRESFYNPIFKRKEIIVATQSARTNFDVRIPLVFTLSFMSKNILGRNRISNVATLVFFDTAGEDLNAEDVMRTENRYILNSSGIIVLLDPLQLPKVRSELAAGTPLPSENTEAKDILTRTANLIRKDRNLSPTDLINIPIAIVFTKIDALDPILDKSSNLMQPSNHDGAFNLGDFEAVNGEIEGLVKEWAGDGIVQQVKLNFRNYAFFGLSALGCNPHSTHKIIGLRPRRVEDPFLWLLWKSRLITHKK